MTRISVADCDNILFNLLILSSTNREDESWPIVQGWVMKLWYALYVLLLLYKNIYTLYSLSKYVELNQLNAPDGQNPASKPNYFFGVLKDIARHKTWPP